MGPRPPVALYVHVPFCVSLCPYCDFVVYAGAAARGPASRVDAFTEALLAEIALRADAADVAFGRERPALRSVYLGGGTPTLLPSASLAAILDLVRSRFGIADGAEVTVESNPGPDERGTAAELAACRRESPVARSASVRRWPAPAPGASPPSGARRGGGPRGT